MSSAFDVKFFWPVFVTLLVITGLGAIGSFIAGG
jgi:hypothetical protein